MNCADLVKNAVSLSGYRWYNGEKREREKRAMLWKNILPGDFQNAVKESKGLCIIPIGCVEAHGVHLPLGCDTIWGAGLVKEVAEREKVVVFPEIYFGEKSGAGEYPGTIIFPTTLIWQILEHSCYEIHRNGFHKILLVSSHGGNAAMLQAFVRQILQKKPEFNVYFYNLGLPKMAEMLDRPEEYPYLQESDWFPIKQREEMRF